jgi:hypothetical protein
VLVAVTLVLASSCSSGSDAVCVSSESGEVCANGGDGSIKFSGSGLEPGSEVELASGLTDPLVLTVEADGSLDPNGMVGFLSLFADTEVTFAVTAIDDQGEPIVGDITVST